MVRHTALSQEYVAETAHLVKDRKQRTGLGIRYNLQRHFTLGMYYLLANSTLHNF